MSPYRAQLHAHATGQRLRSAELRWAAMPDPKPGQSILHGMPDELGNLACGEYDAWMWDSRIDPETGLPLPGEEFTQEEIAALSNARAKADASVEFQADARRAAKIPTYSFFAPLPREDAAVIDGQLVVEHTPPPLPSLGGHNIPHHCLTPRLLSQRPQLACAHRAG